ncbi:MAG: helix-turn-helix domain-containing protein [Actinomycetota bacterium]|nr:helix-turn-helix domain-containing protein [Actinomycetota bacterium]
MASLGDADRSGRPPKFTPVQVARVKAAACAPPADVGLPLSRWSCPEPARYAVATGFCESIAPTTVRRWLSEDALKPGNTSRGSSSPTPTSFPRPSHQIEIYFSIVQPKVVSPNDFTELDEVIYRLARFEERYNHTARPFKWKFTTIDLDDLLHRLDNHTPS